MLGWPFADVQSGAESAGSAADIRKGTAPPSCFCSQAETRVLFTVHTVSYLSLFLRILFFNCGKIQMT